MFNNFFQNKKILITGVAGVKGTWLALELLALGSQVIGLDRQQPAADSNFMASHLNERITFIQGDVNDLPLLQEAMSDADGVFHLAAISLVGEARRNPLETYRSNTLGTASVLEAMCLAPKTHYGVFITTDKVYAPKQGALWTETDTLFASEPYPISKACAEAIIADYYQHYLKAAGKRIGVARAGNVLLGGDLYSSKRTKGAGHLHVDCFEALAEGRPPELYTPNFTRPYSYGLDILCGYLSLMSRLDEAGVDGEAFNFGPHERYGIANGLLATKICEAWGGNTMWRTTNPRTEPFEKQSLAWDKAQQRLAWQPALTLYETVQELTYWYQAWNKQQRQEDSTCRATINQTLIRRHQRAAAHMQIWWATS